MSYNFFIAMLLLVAASVIGGFEEYGAWLLIAVSAWVGTFGLHAKVTFNPHGPTKVSDVYRR